MIAPFTPSFSLSESHANSCVSAASPLTLAKLSPANTRDSAALVVCGPSGVGKGTIISRFIEAHGNDYDGDHDRSQRRRRTTDLPAFAFSVSHTTRTPRPGEVDGVHYNFVDRSFMVDAVSSGTFFIEHAEVHGNMYGSSFGSMFLGDGAASHGDDDGGGGRDRVGGGAGTGTTWICGPSSSSSSYDVDSRDDSNGYRRPGRSERQCLLDIDVAGVRSIKEFQARQRRLRGEMEGAREGRRGGGGRRRSDIGQGPVDVPVLFPRGSHAENGGRHDRWRTG